MSEENQVELPNMQNYLSVFPFVAVQIKYIENGEIHTVEGGVFRPAMGDEYLHKFNPAAGGFYILVGNSELYLCEKDFLDHFDVEWHTNDELGVGGNKYIETLDNDTSEISDEIRSDAPIVAEAVVTEDLDQQDNL